MTMDPLWTMPGHMAQHGGLTHSVTHLADNARYSVVCSTFNFQRSSGLGNALRRAAQLVQPERQRRNSDKGRRFASAADGRVR